MIHYFSCLIALLMVLSSPLASSQERIPHAVGLYLTGKGQDYIETNVEEIFFRNGITIDNAYFSNLSVETQEQSLEEMLVNQHDLKEIIETIKENVSRYFIGFDLDKHKFQIELHEIEFFANWSDVRLSFIKPQFDELVPNPPTMTLKILVQATKVELNIRKTDIRDLNHSYLGEYGLDHASLLLDESFSDPLFLEMTVDVFKNNGAVEFVVQGFESNISDVIFQSNFRPPLRLPVIEIRINDHVVTVNQSEIENLFREKQQDIFRVAQEEAQNYLNTEAKDLINEMIAEKVVDGLIEVNQMDPPGAPEGVLAPKFEWGLNLTDVDMDGDLVHIGLEGLLRDPLNETSPNLSSRLVARRPPSLAQEFLNGHDMIMSLNQGFVNKIIQLSRQRGYFSQVDLENGESIKLTKVPELILNGGSSAHLAIEIEYTITGMQAMFVKNPIRLSFNLGVDLAVNPATQKTELVSRGVDLNSVNLPDRYIRMFASKVRSAARDTIQEMQKDLSGMVLVDEFPIPASLFGIDLQVSRTRADNSGHLLLFIDFKE
jgi:hypothetical protein